MDMADAGNMKNIAISVCMPVYNGAAHLRECIDSILAQTFGDFELLIADDGSTDGSAAIVRSYTDPRIRLLTCPHRYIASSRSATAVTASSSWIAMVTPVASVAKYKYPKIIAHKKTTVTVTSKTQKRNRPIMTIRHLRPHWDCCGSAVRTRIVPAKCLRAWRELYKARQIE